MNTTTSTKYGELTDDFHGSTYVINAKVQHKLKTITKPRPSLMIIPPKLCAMVIVNGAFPKKENNL